LQATNWKLRGRENDTPKLIIKGHHITRQNLEKSPDFARCLSSAMLGCFVLMPFIPTRKACWPMDTNPFTTFGTNPFKFFILYEISDPNFIYHFETINHAHPVLGSVSLIQLFQPGAGKTITSIGTILGFTFGELFAVSDFTCSSVF
jgi:hypothetical protein